MKKLILTIVIDVENEEEAIDEYNNLDESYTIAICKLNGKDWHPSFVVEK
jgi:hypothetical protein